MSEIIGAIIFPIEKLPYFASSVIMVAIAVYLDIVHSLQYGVLVNPFKIRVTIGMLWSTLSSSVPLPRSDSSRPT